MPVGYTLLRRKAIQQHPTNDTLRTQVNSKPKRQAKHRHGPKRVGLSPEARAHTLTGKALTMATTNALLRLSPHLPPPPIEPLSAARQNTELSGDDHAPVTRGRMRTQYLLPHGPIEPKGPRVCFLRVYSPPGLPLHRTGVTSRGPCAHCRG